MGASTFTSLNDGKRILPDGREIKFKIENVDNVKIPLVTASYYGQKSVILCSEPLFTVLVNGCKLDNYLRKKDGIDMISFNQFIDNLVNIHISSVIQNHQKQLLDTSMKELEIPNKTKK